jgi:hypothetical protein
VEFAWRLALQGCEENVVWQMMHPSGGVAHLACARALMRRDQFGSISRSGRRSFEPAFAHKRLRLKAIHRSPEREDVEKK